MLRSAFLGNVNPWSLLPKTPAIYFHCRRGGLIYCGCCSILNRRIYEHLRADRIQRETDLIYWIDDYADAELEREYIRTFRPKMNHYGNAEHHIFDIYQCIIDKFEAHILNKCSRLVDSIPEDSVKALEIAMQIKAEYKALAYNLPKYQPQYNQWLQTLGALRSLALSNVKEAFASLQGKYIQQLTAEDLQTLAWLHQVSVSPARTQCMEIWQYERLAKMIWNVEKAFGKHWRVRGALAAEIAKEIFL